MAAGAHAAEKERRARSVRHTLKAWLWPTRPGLAVPGLWLGYVAYLLLRGGLPWGREALVASWPVPLLYAGSCFLAAWERRGARARLWPLVALAGALAAADLAVKAWIVGRPELYSRPLTLLPGLLAVDPVHNEYGTMLAIPGAVPYVTILAVILVPLSVLGYRYYLRDEEPVVWAHAGFVGFLAGALAKAGDLLLRGLIVDYLHIPGLPIADLADIYLLWIGGGCVLATTFYYPQTWPDPRPALRGLVERLRRG
jgi:lipoprotein signal peptidase